MKSALSMVLYLLRWILRGAFPAATLGAIWWAHRRDPREALAGWLIGNLCAFVVMLWAEVDELKEKVRDLGRDGDLERQAREMVRRNRQRSKGASE